MISLEKAKHPLKGDVFVPGDKSISHRSIMFGALAEGTTEITGFLESADCLSTIECFKKLGIIIDHTMRPTHGVPTITVHGRGLHGLTAADSTLYTGNSGTTTRLMSGILAAQPFDSNITGDSSIEKRPMSRIIKPLSQMGADISSVLGNDCAPLHIGGGRKLRGINYRNPIASAQVKSAILLAGLYADGETVVYEPALSRNHSEIMLSAFGADVHNEIARDGSAAAILNPGMPLHGIKINVPGDISSAAYFIAAALIVPGSELLIRNVGINNTRCGILTILKQMGADITLMNINEDGEPRADILVKHSELHGNQNNKFEIGGKDIPTMIDELPMVAVLAATAGCDTIIKDAAELKVKESDRIATVVENLKAMGADLEATDDGMIIHGGKPLHGADINTHNDHRLAMCFAIAALAAEGTTRILDDACVGISYPTFFSDLQRLL
ncbi:MAG: 3-phosphoshikimate 1-carboxyvinyltransferase [Butyrivibrio sp.]|jgi:3-phosphoshikimate 1-carboxyvinyltransferase|uniref:3-phosphoshikimate 1-carboxyvinyltransferase n=1 Tax=Butyrivibrio sp. TaxID=28121 RepID=UPI0025C19611|nr:3-phosphoshikimate 1-carboxyvinyltransferase [Butyrivibrio sp.]MBQ6589239.1 3-phosphoshikimate 1-carboxyvinyltransferase [Butyrivibrio sp.]